MADPRPITSGALLIEQPKLANPVQSGASGAPMAPTPWSGVSEVRPFPHACSRFSSRAVLAIPDPLKNCVLPARLKYQFPGLINYSSRLRLRYSSFFILKARPCPSCNWVIFHV
jgi:hypothetical protein